MSVLQSENEARAFVAERCNTPDFARLDAFVLRLRQANRYQNLVSQKSLDAVWLRHLADSAQLLDHVPRETSPWLDLGTGAGLPGLVLAIMQPLRSFILVESRNLRTQWLIETTADLNIKNCKVLAADVRKVPRFDAAVISARAFAPLNRLVAQSARFSTTATCWVLPKGRSAAQEVEALTPALRGMFHVKQSVTSQEAGIVLGTGKVEMAT